MKMYKIGNNDYDDLLWVGTKLDYENSKNLCKRTTLPLETPGYNKIITERSAWCLL